MSPPGRPKGEYRSAQREASPVSPPGDADVGRAPRRAMAREAGLLSLYLHERGGEAV